MLLVSAPSDEPVEVARRSAQGRAALAAAPALSARLHRLPDGPGEVAEGADAVGQEEILEPTQPGDRADQVDQVLALDAGIAGMGHRLAAVAGLGADAH